MIHARADYQRFQDPLGKIKEDEPVMLFRAQDVNFVPLLQYYALLLRANNAKQDIIEAVNGHVELAKEWQMNNPIKVPDL